MSTDKQKEAARKYRNKNREALREYQREYRKTHNMKPYQKASYDKNKDKRTEYRRNRYRKEPWHYLVTSAKRRASTLDVPFDLDANHIKDIWPADGLCPILKTPLAAGNLLENRNQSASLDRITPALGYIRGNVQIVSFRANRLKGDGTLEEFRILVDYLERALLNK